MREEDESNIAGGWADADNELREKCSASNHVLPEGADRCQCGAAVKVGKLADLLEETKAEYLAAVRMARARGSTDPVVITSL